jgi:ribosomal protein L37E
MKYQIRKTDEHYDHHNVIFHDDDKNVINGLGYIGKIRSTIGLIKCPVCNRENYALNVTTGICTWCGFNLNTFIDGEYNETSND